MLCFFFQAEDGIRDLTVTGVQTCALPIYRKKAIINSTINEIQLLRQQQEQQQRSLPRRGHNSHNSVQQMLSTQRFHPYGEDRKSTRLNSSHSQISYAVFCLKKKKKKQNK